MPMVQSLVADSHSVLRTLLLAAVVLIAPACDAFRTEGGQNDRRARAGRDVPSRVAVWGCKQAITTKAEELDPRWREESTVVGDFGFNVTAADHSGVRRHRRADIEVKLPIIIDGHSGATVWVPHHDRHRVALILADVPRRGPGNSYRIADGHHAVRFEPCTERKWSAWTAGLALADRREIVLEVEVDGERGPTLVPLGPWESFTIGPG
jgi:hypothetical protein